MFNRFYLKKNYIKRKNEIFRKVLSHPFSFFEFSLFYLSVVHRKSNGGTLRWPLASYNSGFCNSNKTKTQRRLKLELMNNKIMFIVGCVIFFVYIYFLLSIIRKQHKIQQKENMSFSDTNDLDGIGNQGRIPDKKPINRAP